jgi:predicted PurR-regulated permease PerM
VARDKKETVRSQLTTTSFIEVAIRLAALALLLYWTLILVQPFLSIAIWSAVLTVALYPVFDWTSRLLGGRRRIAAALITLLSLVIIVGPATWLALGLVNSLRLISERLDLANLTIPAPSASIKEWPLIGEPIYQFWQLASTNLSAAMGQILPQLKPLGSSLLRIGADTGLGIVMFSRPSSSPDFYFRRRKDCRSNQEVLVRLNPDRGEEFVEQAGATIRAVSRGVIGISVLQALLAGIGLMLPASRRPA